jgi:hypothetical protein
MASVGIALVLAVIAVAVVIATNPDGYGVSRNGCVSVLLASSTGGQIVHECGAPARSWCRNESRQRGPIALKVEAQCRLAGIGANGRPLRRESAGAR